MVMWIAIIIIIILMCLDKDEKQKQKEIENQIVGYNTMNGRPILRKHVNITGYDTRTGQPLFEYKRPIIGYNPFTGDPIFEGDKVPELLPTKQPMTEEDKTRLSNTILMITGAVLIVIASIIFLATGWETMHGFLKTLILFGIQMIFYLFGYVSNNKLNIPKIAKMFNYLTLSFVPIILLSLSFFELAGDYFSIGCDGFTYYVGLSLIASDIVYKIYGKAKKDLFVKRSSLIVEAFAILFIVSNIDLMHIEAFALIIHTIIIYLLLQGGFLDGKAYDGLNLYYSILLIAISALPTLVEVNIMSFTNLILLALNFFVRCVNSQQDSEKKPLLILFFISYLLSIRIIEQVEISPYFLYLLSLLPILGLTKVVNTSTMKNNIIKVVGLLTVAITIYSIFDSEQTIYYLLTYIIGFILSVIVYLITKKSFYKFWSYILFTSIFFCICYITDISGLEEYILLLITILIYAIEVIYEKLKDKSSELFIIGSLCIDTLYLIGENTMLIPLILMTIYMLLERKNKKLLIPMFASFLIYSLENKTIVSTIFSILITIYILCSIKKESFNRYTIFSLLTIITLCIYLETSAYVTWGALLLWGLIHYLIKQKENNEIYVTAMIFGMFGLYTKSLVDLDSELYANYALGIMLVAISMTKGVLRKCDETLISFLEWAVIGGLTILGAIVIEEPIDGVVYLGILLILSILSYSKKWRNYLYSSIISMIFGVIVLTAEYWKEIPWYIYILIIGLAFIIFAMYDEKRKQNKKIKEQMAIQNQLKQEMPIIPQEVPKPKPELIQPQEKQTTTENNTKDRVSTFEVVEDTSSKEKITIENTHQDEEKEKINENGKKNTQNHTNYQNRRKNGTNISTDKRIHKRKRN